LSETENSAQLNRKQNVAALTRGDCILILVVGFLGWGFAGCHLSITSLVMRVAVADLLPDGTAEAVIGQWFGWLVCAFLFGAAAGGYLFGFIGDRFGRSKAMALSIICYSVFSGLTWFANSPEALLILRFLTCAGLGGMWPNGIALVSEAWPNVSRPVLAGIMGTSANIGILLFSVLTVWRHVTIEDWRWTMLVGASPVILGIVVWRFVPESPSWLGLPRDGGNSGKDSKPPAAGIVEIFTPPILKTTIIGILLGAIPLFGGWGVSNWSAAWASEVGDAKKQTAIIEGAQVATSTSKETPKIAKADKNGSDPALKSRLSIYRSLPGSITSLLGGVFAYLLGRKRSYFFLCVGAFVCTQVLFRLDDPTADQFKWWTAALGAFSGAFFGWLPLCLPELFPTRVRATGSGVSFNWGRILAGIGVLASAAALREAFQGRYPDVGLVCGYVYAIGLIVILFAPDTSRNELNQA
jgi:SHS family sialic acid transporter-like MFS transporter